MNKKRLTIRDVANVAGCSIATVSRVLNNSGPASTKTKDRVLAVASELGFSFNELGRSLQSQRSQTLGIIVPSLSNPVFAAAIEGAHSEAAAAGYQILLACSNYDAKTEVQAARTLLGKQIDGALATVAAPDQNPALRLLKAKGTPYCLIFNQSATSQPTVGVDNVAASQLAADMLLKAGHQQMAFIALRFSSSERARLRYEGFRRRLRQIGSPAPLLLEVNDDLFDLSLQLEALLKNNPGITALYASNDMLALEAMRTVRMLGLRIPQDISLIGFDGIALADMVEPSLATIATPNYEMGRRAASRVISAIECNPFPAALHTTLPFEFRTGGSLGLADPKKLTSEQPLARQHASPKIPVYKHEQ